MFFLPQMMNTEKSLAISAKLTFSMLIQLHKGGIFPRLKPTTLSFFVENKFCLQIQAGTVDNIQVEVSSANNSILMYFA